MDDILFLNLNLIIFLENYKFIVDVYFPYNNRRRNETIER